MKKYIFLIINIILLSSFQDFLDVQPESNIDKDQLFSTEAGFKEALNGVYTLCASQQLYGEELTFGNLDVLAQNYDFNDVELQKIAAFDYSYTAFEENNNDIWTSAYRAIANCNNILSQIDEKKSLFTGKNYELIKGEALCLRAYLHFDVLRMFAPSFKSQPEVAGIPYVTNVSTSSTPFSTVTQVLEKAIADLLAAKALLAVSDPMLPESYVVGYPDPDIDEDATELNNPDLFLQNRRHRMNYFSACGELARVYLYKNDLSNSLIQAKEVIESEKFPWTRQADVLQTDPELKDRIYYKELVTAWFVPGSLERLNELYSGENPGLSATTAQINDIFEVATIGAEDMRYTQGFLKKAATAGGTERSLMLKYNRTPEPMSNIHPLVAPAIRLSEMYYIAAEASFDTNPGAAVQYFTSVWRNRGIEKTISGSITKDEFMDLLVNDARKEFYGESQIFFMYKRLNYPVKISPTQTYAPSDKIFVFPIPNDEYAYRNN